MKQILVTGGAGFIGSHTVVELVNSGYQPIIVDNFSNSEPSVIANLERLTKRKIAFYNNDFQDQKFLKKLFTELDIKGVIHFAAYKAVGESVKDPLRYYKNNVGGLIDLLESMKESKVPSLVFSSSCTVYGEADRLPLTEDSEIKPAVSPYGATKQIAELIISDSAAASESLKALSLRYFNPIGAHPSAIIGELPKGTPTILVPFITQTVAGLQKKLIIHGDNYPTPDGTCIRDYIHVVDLAKAHIKALEHLDKRSGGFYDVFNIGTGKGNSVLEVVKTFEKVNNIKVPYEIGPRRPGDIVSSYASVDKAEKVLGWRAEKTLADSLEDAWRWQKTLS